MNSLLPCRDLQLPAIIADETLYSWCARFNKVSLILNSKTTSNILFGNSNAARRHDIQYQYINFEKNTQSLLGKAELLLNQHSMFGFYKKFLPVKLSEIISNSLLHGDNPNARTKMGLNKYPTELSMVLKHCPECLLEQSRTDSFNWWKTSHQFPTSFFCASHGTPLELFKPPHYRGICNHLYLPNDRLLNTNKLVICTEKLFISGLNKISKWGYLINDINNNLADDTLRWCYLQKAMNKGWLSFDGSARTQEIRDAFIKYYGQAVVNFFGREFLGDLHDVNSGFIAHLLRMAPSRRHPLKHILMINFLFDCSDDFLSTYHEVKRDLEEGGSAVCTEKLKCNQKILIDMVSKQGFSLNKVASSLDTSVTSAAKFLDKESIIRIKKPRIVGTDQEIRLVQLLKEGLSRKDICQNLGIKASFIKDYLGCHTTLKKEWCDAYFKKQQLSHRNQLINTLNRHPDLPIKLIRRLPSNGFQWLYINDRTWLLTTLPSLWKR